MSIVPLNFRTYQSEVGWGRCHSPKIINISCFGGKSVKILTERQVEMPATMGQLSCARVIFMQNTYRIIQVQSILLCLSTFSSLESSFDFPHRPRSCMRAVGTHLEALDLTPKGCTTVSWPHPLRRPWEQETTWRTAGCKTWNKKTFLWQSWWSSLIII